MFLFSKPKAIKPQLPPDHTFTFSFTITIEHGTIREQCAIDAGMQCITQDRDMYTYSGDTLTYTEYQKYIAANKHAITKEELTDRYTY